MAPDQVKDLFYGHSQATVGRYKEDPQPEPIERKPIEEMKK